MADELLTPGQRISEELAIRGWTQEDLARVIGRHRPEINRVVAGKLGVTADLALLLAAAFTNTTAEYWLGLEAARQLRDRQGDSTDAASRRAHLFSMAPVREMEKRGWIKGGNDIDAIERDLLRFLGIRSIDETPSLMVATRRSDVAPNLTPAQMAWCMRAKHLAAAIPVMPFCQARLEEAQSELRTAAAFVREAYKLPSILQRYGIRFVVVEPLASARIDGAALWLDQYSPVIAVSIRYDRIDSFWFTVMHEFAHIRAGDALSVDADLAGDDFRPSAGKDEIERRADLAAAASLIATDEIESFINRVGPLYSKTRIVQFANRIKMHPGIIVGQLQHRGEIGYSANREMLVKIRDAVIEASLTDGYGRTIPDDAI